MLKEKVDIKENNIIKIDIEVLDVLLIDRTTNKNIKWETNNYSIYGKKFEESKPITSDLISGENGNIIKPRVEKTKREQEERIKKKAEVFTPSWVCNKQNNLVDNSWFGYQNMFNFENDTKWETNTEKVKFPENKSWADYIKDTRLEVSCGEAPYLTSRYDTTTGNMIAVKDRIGFLDRKLRVVSENCETEDLWIVWAKEAVKNVYGYDWQGDNVLLARENLLYTIMEHFQDKFEKELSKVEILDFAKIISYNIWQMDGIKYVIPNSCTKVVSVQMTLFGEDKVDGAECPGCEKGNIHRHNGKYCKVMNWETGRMIKFISLIGGKNGR